MNVNLFRRINPFAGASTRTSGGAAENPDLGFVACIEGGVLERQTLLLFESIRRYTGRFKDCAIYALSPRAGHAISHDARRRLEDLRVHYCDAILNTVCPQYGPANRVAAAAHVEETRRHEVLVVLDSDTLFLREPEEFILPRGTDVLLRPVDLKGVSTTGRGDACDAYWRDLGRCCGVDYDSVPWGESFVDRQRIKANYNGGLVVARGGFGVMRRWADFFFRSVEQGLRPRPGAAVFRAGAGTVEPAAAELWGSNQAALSLAAWSNTRRVRQLPPTYNYPLHLHEQIPPKAARAVFRRLVHVHYHWLFAPDSLAGNPLLLPSGPLTPEQRDWLLSATPIV